MEAPFSFGAWVRRRRKALDLMQAEFARQLGCATVTLQKIEQDERRPSKELTARLADVLAIPADERAAFLLSARGERAVDRLTRADRQPGGVVPWRALPRPRHRLPIPPTPLIGRAQEVADAVALLRQSNVRLLTLTGPGGIGKTRLAIQVANEVQDAFVDGVQFVDLAALSDAALVIPAIAQALGVRERSDQPLEVTLQAALCAQQVLLVLDNFEQLLAAAVPIAALLQAAPALTVLVTSRAPLHVSAEQQLIVPPLRLPDPRHADVAAQVAQSEAGALFIARAQALRPTFNATAHAASIAAICTQVEGLPLAIELAAARTTVLSLPELLHRLEQRLAVLTGGSRDLPARQQTIRATIDWSYALLTAPEQALFRRLGVFVGGFTLTAAEAVCGRAEMGAVLEPLARLVDTSLLEVEPGGDAVRYRFLKPIRHYAVEKLVASGESDRLRRRHGEYYLALAEAAPPIVAPQSFAWLTRLQPERDNLRAALQWAIDHADADIAVRLAGALGWFWYRHAEGSEAERWLERVLALPGAEHHSSARAWLLYRQAEVALFDEGIAAGRGKLEDSLALFEALHDTHGSATVQLNLAIAARESGDVARATALFEEILVIARAHDDAQGMAWAEISLGQVAVLCEDAGGAAELLEAGLARMRAVDVHHGIAWALNHQGHVAQLTGDYARAAALHRESLPLFREIGEPNEGIAWALAGLGDVALAQGDLAAATTHFTASLHVFQQVGNLGVCWCVAGLAGVAALGGRPARAARLWGAMEAERERSGKRMAPASRATYERAVATSRRALGTADFTAAWAAGRALTREQAIADAREHDAMPPAPTNLRSADGETDRSGNLSFAFNNADRAPFTTREREVLRLVAQGLRSGEVAAALGLSPRTVDVHLRAIYRKLGVRSRTAATRVAIEQHLV